MIDNESIKALERLKNTKDYLKEQYQGQVKKCPFPELKAISKQTYEDNKKAFDIAIKAIEEFSRQKAEIERLDAMLEDKQFRCDACDRIGLTRSEYIHCIKQAKSEAVKEFAERLHCHCQSIINHEWNKKVAPVSWADAYEQFDDELDNLLKEMVGEDK